jgi:Ca-activated chloride channel family protein
MNQDDLQKLFTQNLPLPDADSKKRIQAEALVAFRAEQENISAARQGNDSNERPTRTHPHARKYLMKFSQHSPWFGGLAACCLLTLGYITFAPTLMQNTHTPKPIVHGPQAHEADLAEPAAAPPLQGAERRQEKLEEIARSQALGKSQMERADPSANYAADQRVAATTTPATAARMVMERKKADSDLYVPQQTEYRDRFTSFAENPLLKAAENPVSTFSIDVDTASYSFVRRQLLRGELPPQDAVRIEEMLNYFDYAYPAPQNRDAPFSTTVAVLDSPWRKGNKLVHIGIKGYEIPEQPDSNLVFLLDVSGSMESPDKLPLVKQSMNLLLGALKSTDRVAIVVYAGAAGTVLEPTQVKDRDKILAALNHLQAGGSTAGAQGLKLAYQLAEQHFDKNAVNRVILATDGDFNVGVTQDERLEDFVKNKKDKGIYLSVLGFGEGNYQDALMQTLAQNGNGVAAYIDTLSEARKVLVTEATSALFPIANDVKIQVEFNPALVTEYRLIGYETRALQREDFNNDKVDAGDIGAGHSVTALYEITPTGTEQAVMDNLRYGKNQASATTDQTEYGFLRLRYKLPGTKQSLLLNSPINSRAAPPTGQLKQELDFATAVAGFAQLLRGGKYIQDFTYDDVITLAQASKGPDSYGYRTEFIQLVHMAKIAQPL